MKQLQSAATVPLQPGILPLDPTRLEQFLDLQQSLLVPGDAPDTLPDRLAQGVALFLGLTGAAVGLMEDGGYVVLGAHGVPADYGRRYTGAVLGDGLLARALAGGRPVRVPEADALVTVLLPFRAGETAGALHLVTARAIADDDVHLARALALLAGVALANLQQHRRLAQAARLKGDALAAMAHDLRAPLNAILGYTGLLREETFGPLVPEQREVCDTLERQALELVDLLGATLDVARLETGRLAVRVEEFALADVLAALQRGTFAQPARSGRLSFQVPPDLPPLRSDRVKLKEIVQNLLDNALKHAGEATVEVDANLAPDGERLRLTVRDHGPGIPAEVAPHLFEPFRCAGGRGTGFGLYIVRCFVEALGGRVAAHNPAGGGTAVTVELPLVAPAPRRPA